MVTGREHAQRYFGDGPTAIAVSLASVTLSRIESRSSGSAGSAASAANIYRRTESTAWQNVGRADFDGAGRPQLR
jgi:hypothetical protein